MDEAIRYSTCILYIKGLVVKQYFHCQFRTAIKQQEAKIHILSTNSSVYLYKSAAPAHCRKITLSGFIGSLLRKTPLKHQDVRNKRKRK
ncbi:hypothetical protein GCWU000325_01297 [Alloprevotella tannerae ATCC 51259]|uniref:Uncharacterized protein n=1 Tax=Alloprevotella tannerae ATCC 51259 TaxID=626522 RepID=C9LGF5_9BACT|nr:hypothetical protein GCWU000325_01297 [Alloprevotella tannerae ATCC 51259]